MHAAQNAASQGAMLIGGIPGTSEPMRRYAGIRAHRPYAIQKMVRIVA
jgi:hypothetical protein